MTRDTEDTAAAIELETERLWLEGLSLPAAKARATARLAESAEQAD